MNIYTNQLSINKYALRSYATRPISFKATSSDIPSEREIITTIRQNKLDPSLVDPKTKKTLFFTIVENDMCNAVNYLCMKPKLIADVINTPTDGKTPLDAAKSDKMKHILLAKKAKHFSELSFNEVQKTQVVSQEAQVIKSEEPLVEDARVAAIKANLEEPIVVKPAEVAKPDYFDAFEEIEDDGVEVNDSATKANSNQDSAEVQKETPLETDSQENRTSVERKIPEAYNKYNVLEIKPNDPKTLDEIIGLENIKRELDENVIKPLKEQQVSITLKANNVDLPNGILLSSVADPESVVKAVSNETGMPVLQVINLEELSPMINDIKKNFKETGTKTILFIPKFDKLFVEQQSQMPERNFTLLMNQCREKGVLLVATTDDKEKVCKSFMQPGIFDKILQAQKPTLEDRKIYLKQYFGDKHLFSDLQNETTINELATIMDGFNYSAIDRVLEESARTAVSNSKDKVSREIVDSELKEFTAERGLTPVDKNNITGQYDTEMKRVPVTEYEPKALDELGGMPEIKDRLRKLYIEPLKKIDILKQELGNAAIPDGAIFYGPAGNGKTLTAKTLARELGLPFYETKLSDIGTSYVHEESKAMRKLAQQLRDKFKATGEMSVWFLDEFDSLGSERNGASQHNKELVDTLLQEFNNPSEMGYILIAATNDLSNVDSALKRRGRLGNWIPFHNPEFIERVDTIRKELNKASITRDLAKNQEYAEKLAKELDGNSMSNIVSVINDAKRMHLLSGDDFDTAIKKALDLNTKREMGEFCTKAGLEAHTYRDTDYKSLDELGGMEETKQQLKENIIDVWNPEVRQALIANKRTLPGGVILEGPPGGGKTTIIETLARQMDVPLYKMDYSKQHNTEFIHAVSRNVSEIFERLKLQSKILKKPVILFFDEAEKFFPRHAERHQIEEVNTYKELMNNASKDGIILIGATNHIDQVNAEIIGNPRRMGTVIHVGNPDEEGRKNLLEKILTGLPVMAVALTATQIGELAKVTEGLSIGKIADGIDKVITQAVKRNSKVSFEMLSNSLKKIAR